MNCTPAEIHECIPLVGKIAGHFSRRLARPSDADQLESDANLALFMAAVRFTGGAFKKFAAQRIQWGCIDSLRVCNGYKGKRRIMAGEIKYDLAGQDKGIRDVEARDEVQRCLAGIPARERALLLGHFVEGRTYRELATPLGISSARVGQLIKVAVAQLRDAFPKLCMATQPSGGN